MRFGEVLGHRVKRVFKLLNGLLSKQREIIYLQPLCGRYILGGERERMFKLRRWDVCDELGDVAVRKLHPRHVFTARSK